MPAITVAPGTTGTFEQPVCPSPHEYGSRMWKRLERSLGTIQRPGARCRCNYKQLHGGTWRDLKLQTSLSENDSQTDLCVSTYRLRLPRPSTNATQPSP